MRHGLRQCCCSLVAAFAGVLSRRRGEERGGGAGNEPRSFKKFLLEDVPDNVSPLEAQALYEQYLTAHFGDQLRAKFEQQKTLEQ